MKPVDILSYLLKGIHDDVAKTSGSFDRNTVWVSGIRGIVTVALEDKPQWLLLEVPSDSRVSPLPTAKVKLYARFDGDDENKKQLLDSAMKTLQCKFHLSDAVRALVSKTPAVWKVHPDSDSNSTLYGFVEKKEAL